MPHWLLTAKNYGFSTQNIWF